MVAFTVFKVMFGKSHGWVSGIDGDAFHFGDVAVCIGCIDVDGEIYLVIRDKRLCFDLLLGNGTEGLGLFYGCAVFLVEPGIYLFYSGNLLRGKGKFFVKSNLAVAQKITGVMVLVWG